MDASTSKPHHDKFVCAYTSNVLTSKCVYAKVCIHFAHGSGAVIRIHCALIQWSRRAPKILWSRRAPKIPRRNLQTFVGHGSIRNAVQSYTEAKRTWRSEAAEASSSTDMECDAVCKDGYKGQSKCGKGKSKKPKGDECYICEQARPRTERLLVPKTQEERKEKAKSKERESRKAKARTRTSQSLK